MGGTGEDREATASKAGPRHTSLLDVLCARGAGTLADGSRVAGLAVDTGRILELDDARLADLRIAGRLHDVGKVAVPDAVLGKPGPLDDREMWIVRTHPAVGAQLVRAWGFPGAAEIVLEHHERVDGRGYPFGLAGEDISLEARILHAVDALAAMTSDRPYRPAMSLDDALAELRRLGGTQFDSRVVAALERVCRRSPEGAGQDPSWTVEAFTRRARSSR